MRRALLATLEYPPTHGGVGRYLASVRAFAPDRVSVLAPPDQTEGERDVIRRSFFRPRWPRWWPLVHAIRSEAQATEAQLLLAGQILPVGAATMIASHRLGLPYGVFVHGMDLALARRRSSKRWLAQRILRRAEFVIANSSFTAHLTQSFGIPETNVIVLNPGPGVRPNEGASERTEAFRRRYGLIARLVFLSAGRLVARKGFDRAIEGFSRTKSVLPKTTLLIVGDGPDRKRLEGLAASFGPNNDVLFLGSLPDNELVDAYRSSDVFLLPAREVKDHSGRLLDVEGFGIVFLEAALAGKPVIAGRSGGVPDAVREGVNGILVDPEDPEDIKRAIVRLGEDPELRWKFGEAGKQWVEARLAQGEERRRFRIALGEQPKKFVSVIVPAYNAEATIETTLETISSQTYAPIEVIVVDDGSNDRTSEILARYDARVRIIRQENRGASAARNRGFQESKGDFVLFCDADVTLEPTMIGALVRTLELHPEAAYGYSSFRFGWHTFDLFDFDPERLKEENYISTMSLIRREAFLGFDERLRRYQDWDLWKRMLGKGLRGIWYPKRLFAAPLRGGISRDSAPDIFRLLRRRLLRLFLRAP